MSQGKPFDRRVCTKGFQPSQYYVQPANFWFEDVAGSKSSSFAESKSRMTTTSSRVQADGDNELKPEFEPEPAGTGTVVAILDTGIQCDHQAFGNEEIAFATKVVECKNFINPDEDCKDYIGHGTECAGLACGLSFDFKDEDGNKLPYKFNSPAPGARLMVCKVGTGENDSEEALIRAIVKALNYIVEFNEEDDNEDKRVNVISISFGFESFNKELADAIQNAIINDIIVVCCASNDRVGISSSIAYPGRLGHVLCIGACDMHGQPTAFSSEGREVDFVELGVEVWAPTVHIRKTAVVELLNGKSYSTPSVAGLICRLLQDLQRLSRTRNRSTLYEDMHNVWCMRELLKSMSVMQGHHDKAKGYGKLIPHEYFKKGDEERVRICDEILHGTD